MIKKILASAVLTSMLATPALMAESNPYEVDTYSLVGFEGAYGSFDYERSTTAKAEQINLNGGGVKIGAQSENYRLFVSIRGYDAGEFNYARTYGVEGQYMFNFSKFANFYIGVNAGTTDMELRDALTKDTVKVYDPYVGGDAGFNIHLGDMADLELGARIMNLNSDVTVGTTNYSFENLISGYASIIFKYKMD